MNRLRTAHVLCLVSASLPGAAVVAQSPGASQALTSATIQDLNEAFDAGALTAEGLVGMYLARIEAYDRAGPVLNSLLWV
ncbi:MAG: amidase, partial [Actinobacteria bacterium]|nr:amidase [Actinomycetota bacterium]NIS29242.1 amidase [Actinomycetota bacterium]NIT94823.1 amidase [Actinomycetota bacterium]NIU64635.1 amidase [Actinomycetota bacterium]NIW26426.1 amidase [Actinomycetota bacterium]